MVVHLDLALTFVPCTVFAKQSRANITAYYVPSALNLPADPGPGSWKTAFPGKPNFCRPLVAPSVAVVHAVFCHFTIAPRTARSRRQTWCSGPDGLY
ncbi:hypothetical protein COCVIDRAFT_36409 [Bipolaris victoriae FI3]|uniref:Secreted protein n=1 Tax=Bipolaris victoriae (strain FI3) TaxID=930091 RepID=W7EX85_BIPV3|nr:hypothetical protein COCVIDRAFT_36409 [Bipolaris victoriae FI3]